MPFGFVILSYNEPQQLLRLTQTLTSLYSSPPIACHHNFSQCELDTSLFSSNVHFVRPHLQTGWGHINTVLAGVAALELLYRIADPKWFVLMSGSDYPVASPALVLDDLIAGQADAYIDCQKLTTALRREESTDLRGHSVGPGTFNRSNWQREAFGRYVAVKAIYPRFGGATFIHWDHRLLWNVPLGKFWSRLLAGTHIFAGDPWFTASASAANSILRSRHRESVTRFLCNRRIPEEAYYQTLLASSGLRLSARNYRYTDWPSATGGSPKWLTASDLPTIFASGAHFARKFQPDDPALDEIDAYLQIR